MRNKLRWILAAPALVVMLSSCSLAQMHRYFEWVPIVGQEAADQVVADYEAEKADATAGLHCAEWYDAAIDAGFTPDQWREPLARIMWRESMCNPWADNSSSTADGLTQIVRGTWRSSCPDLPYDQRYIGEINLQCAYRIWRSSGWTPWATY